MEWRRQACQGGPPASRCRGRASAARQHSGRRRRGGGVGRVGFPGTQPVRRGRGAGTRAGAGRGRRVGLPAERGGAESADQGSGGRRLDHLRHHQPVLHLHGARGGGRRPGGRVLRSARERRRGPRQGVAVPRGRRRRKTRRGGALPRLLPAHPHRPADRMRHSGGDHRPAPCNPAVDSVTVNNRRAALEATRAPDRRGLPVDRVRRRAAGNHHRHGPAGRVQGGPPRRGARVRGIAADVRRRPGRAREDGPPPRACSSSAAASTGCSCPTTS